MWPDPIDPKHVVVTDGPGHARQLAASVQGVDILVAVGGDGTIVEVMSGIMDRQGDSPRLAVLPAGTGNDVARSLGITCLADAAAALQHGQSHPFDLVRIDCQREGTSAHGYGFLFGSAGFSANSRIRPWMKRFLGPKTAYRLAILLEILLYRAPHMTVRTEDQTFEGRTYIVIAGNAEYSGGGSVRMSPDAKTNDGDMNITIVSALSRRRVITQLFPKIAKGTHIHQPEVSYLTGQRIEVDSDRPTTVDVDGDVFGTTPATFTLCPQAIQIICPPVRGGPQPT